MELKVIKQIEPLINYCCTFIPANYREDVKSDIVLDLLILIKENNNLDFDSLVSLCLSRLSNIRNKHSKKYKTHYQHTSLEKITDMALNNDLDDYTIMYDLNKITKSLNDNEKKLLSIILETGDVDMTYKEINTFFGYKGGTSGQGMYLMRSLMLKMRNALEGIYNYSDQNRQYYRNKRPKIS